MIFLKLNRMLQLKKSQRNPHNFRSRINLKQAMKVKIYNNLYLCMIMAKKST